MSEQHLTAVVAGVGPGLGAAVCRRLTAAGYAVAGLARSTRFGQQLANELSSAGRVMAFFACDLTSESAVETTLSAVEAQLGPPAVLVYNAGSFLMGPLAETSPEDFQQIWALNCYGAFLCAHWVVPRMLPQGGGTIIFTGATAGVKAAGKFAAFGSAKFALRGLAQSMARELSPRGIHVAHVVVDGIIWTPRSREMHGLDEAQCLDPDAIAETYHSLICQDRSAWTHELDLRPDVEVF